MNETMSLLLATSILALGGLGLYMFKSSDDTGQNGGDEEYNEEQLFGSSSLFNWASEPSKNKENDVEEEQNEEEEEDYRPRKRATKTHKNRKVTGNSRRRYY